MRKTEELSKDSKLIRRKSWISCPLKFHSPSCLACQIIFACLTSHKNVSSPFPTANDTR
jgi:hypothetical protein